MIQLFKKLIFLAIGFLLVVCLPDPDWHEKVKTIDDIKRLIKYNSDQISIQFQKL